MKVAINLWVLRNKHYDGMGLYSINSIRELIKLTPNINYILLVPQNYNEDFFNFDNVKLVKLFPSLRHPLLYIFYSEIILPIYFLLNNADIFLSMDGIATWYKKIKQLDMIYDINSYHFPKISDFKNRLYYNNFFPIYANRADKILTISEFSKYDIATYYHIPEDKIVNVSCSANIGIQEKNDTQNTITREKITGGKEYYFFVGSQMPRKNLSRLILGFDNYKKKLPSDFKLVISGRLSWDTDVLKTLLPKIKHSKDIIFTGRVSDEELTNLLSASYCLCFVSIYEGFGIPILEAMNCNVPIITSNISSMPEIAKDAALYVDPFKIDEIADQLVLMHKNKDGIREKMISNGKKLRENYSWEITARKIMKEIISLKD